MVSIVLLLAIDARGGEATAVVTGFVTSNGTPLAHMRVASDETSTETNERGEYRLLVTPGRRFVRVGTSMRVFDIGAGDVFGNRSPLLNLDLPAWAFDPMYVVSAWQAPRTIRFGVRVAL